MKMTNLFILLIAICFLTPISWAQEQDIPVSQSSYNQIYDVLPAGSINKTLSFEVTATQGLLLDVIIPIDNAQVKIISPSGQIIYTEQTAEVERVLGSSLATPVPGYRIFFPEITPVESGTWQVELSFPSVDYQDHAIVNIKKKTDINIGIAINDHYYVIGEPVLINVLLTKQNQPIIGQEVSILIERPDGTKEKITAYDDGKNGDGRADDGLYHSRYHPAQEGRHFITAQADVDINGETILREMSEFFTTNKPLVTLLSSEINPMFDKDGCLDYLDLVLEFEALEPINMSIHTNIYKADRSDDNNIHADDGGLYETGIHQQHFTFSKKKLMKAFPNKDVINLTEVNFFNSEPDMPDQANIRKPTETSIDLSSLNICRDPAEVGEVSVINIMSNDGSYIEALQFDIPVYFRYSGNYEGYVYFTSTQTMNDNFVTYLAHPVEAGDSIMRVTIPGEYAGQFDGPYQLIGFRMYERQVFREAIYRSKLFTTETYKKEQFLPKQSQVISSDSYSLERINWRSQPSKQTELRVGGYARSGASISDDYEVLTHFDISAIQGEITSAQLKVQFADSTLKAPFEQVAIHPVEQGWNAAEVSYDNFCSLFIYCPAWDNTIATIDAAKAEQTSTISNDALLDLVKQWQSDPESNNGIALTANPSAREHFINITNIELVLETLQPLSAPPSKGISEVIAVEP